MSNIFDEFFSLLDWFLDVTVWWLGKSKLCCFHFVLVEKYERATLRQTQVMVIPSNGDLNENFPVFDSLINAINQARRNARDYVTEISLEKLDEQIYGDGDRDWR